MLLQWIVDLVQYGSSLQKKKEKKFDSYCIVFGNALKVKILQWSNCPSILEATSYLIF